MGSGNGVGGGVVAMGVLVGCVVEMLICELFGGVGVVRVRKLSSRIGDEMLKGEEFDDDDSSLAKQQGFTLILAVLLGGLDGGEEVFDLVILAEIEF